MRLSRIVAGMAGAAALGTGGYVGLVTGALTLDVGVGRRTRPLGPITKTIAAPPDAVFAVAAAPYDVRPTRAMAEKVEVLERTDAMVLAAHRTPVGYGLTAVTVESVTFDPPHVMGFRLLRGPVPLVTETFTFGETAIGTELRYEGILGTDFWILGERWAAVVAPAWEATVSASLDDIAAESERRTAR